MSPKGIKLTKSKRYPNLFRDNASGMFIFRKYSSVKRKEFFGSTAEKDNEARAYKVGLEAFNEWIGNIHDQAGVVYFGKLAARYLRMKLENTKLAKSTRSEFQNLLLASSVSNGQKDRKFRPRLIDAFGHYPVGKINNEIWMTWVNEILADHPGFKFFNSRKALLEILHYAHECSYLDRVPKLEKPDADPAPPRELKWPEIKALFHAAHYVEIVRGPGKTMVRRMKPGGVAPYRVKNWIKLLMFICWKQGGRPGEVLQYEWAMIRFEEGPHGRLHIPARISKNRRPRVIELNPSVSRVLLFLKPKAATPFIFPSLTDPERPMANYNKTWAGVCKRAKFAAQMYWFRDTFITGKIRAGRQAIFIAKYVDSSVGMLEKKYAAPSSEDLQKVAE